MTTQFNFRPFPADFGSRFPDGTYAVGRGADPRHPDDVARTKPADNSAPDSAVTPAKRRKKAASPRNQRPPTAAE